MSLWSTSVDDTDSLSLRAVEVDLVVDDDAIVVTQRWRRPSQEGIAGSNLVQRQVEWWTGRGCFANNESQFFEILKYNGTSI